MSDAPIPEAPNPEEIPAPLATRWQTPSTLADPFASADPFPHLVLPGFLDDALARRAADAFPSDVDERWTSYLHYNERKYGMTRLEAFPSPLRELTEALCSAPFLRWLEAVTGWSGLIADPSLEGGGLHATRDGGYLRLHADFTGHPHQPRWRRRLNLIVFLNPDWKTEWGGQLELWERDLRERRACVEPLLNQAVLFQTDETSFHGYPDPVTCPPDVIRRSLALYYYSVEESDFHRRATDYRARPSERERAKWIWLDKQAVNLYTKLKRRFGLSDRFASAVLRRLFKS